MVCLDERYKTHQETTYLGIYETRGKTVIASRLLAERPEYVAAQQRGCLVLDHISKVIHLHLDARLLCPKSPHELDVVDDLAEIIQALVPNYDCDTGVFNDTKKPCD